MAYTVTVLQLGSDNVRNVLVEDPRAAARKLTMLTRKVGGYGSVDAPSGKRLMECYAFNLPSGGAGARLTQKYNLRKAYARCKITPEFRRLLRQR